MRRYNSDIDNAAFVRHGCAIGVSIDYRLKHRIKEGDTRQPEI